MKPAALDAAIPSGATLLLDTSVVLAYLSGAEPASSGAAVVIDGFVAKGRNPAIVSTITVTEALVRPMRAGSASAARIIEDFLLHFPNLRVDSVTVAIAREAARIRAESAAPTPDALILATALAASAAVVVSGDRRWTAIARSAGLPIEVVILS